MNGNFGPNKSAPLAPWLRIVHGNSVGFVSEGVDPKHISQMTAVPHRGNSHTRTARKLCCHSV